MRWHTGWEKEEDAERGRAPKSIGPEGDWPSLAITDGVRVSSRLLDCTFRSRKP